MVDLDVTWPVGKLFDVQMVVNKPGGGSALIGALNNHEDSKRNLFEYVEFVRVGFDSKMEGGAGCQHSLLIDLIEEIHKFQNNCDVNAIERMKQKLLNAINDGVGK